MRGQGKDGYLENVVHMTKTKPYSIHKTFFSPSSHAALYLHWHPEIEFCYLEEGELDFCVEETCFHMRAGEAVFIPPNLLHSARCTPKSNGIFRALVFSPDFIASPMDAMQFQKYVGPVLQNNVRLGLYLKPDIPWQKRVLSDLVRIFEQEEGTAGMDLATGGLVLVIWQYLYNFHISDIEESSLKEETERQLQETIRYIHTHYQEDISLEMLAQTAHVSEGQLCRSFRQLTGNTPFTYLKRFRIRQSCAYLAGSEKKISEICTLCGFNNISYFNREFLKMMKVTPSEYRKQCGREQRTTGQEV